VATDPLTRINLEAAESSGLLDYDKIRAGAPLRYRLVLPEHVEALKQAKIPFIARANLPLGPIHLGYVDPDIYSLIIFYEDCGGYNDMTLGDFLLAMCG